MLTHRVKTTLLVKAGTKEKAEEKIRQLLRSVYITPVEIEFEGYEVEKYSYPQLTP